jgi:hypothetical protein
MGRCLLSSANDLLERTGRLDGLSLVQIPVPSEAPSGPWHELPLLDGWRF